MAPAPAELTGAVVSVIADYRRLGERPGGLRRGVPRQLPCWARVVLDEGGKRRRKLGPRHDHVDHAVREQKLGGLESFRQLLPGDLLDDPGTGKPDERAGL